MPMNKIFKIYKATFYLFRGFISFPEACDGFHGFDQAALLSQIAWPYHLPLW